MSYYRTGVPVMDASAARDDQLYCVQIKGWFLTSLLGLASGLAIDAAWRGTPEEISTAIDDAEEQMVALMSSGCCNGVQSVQTNKAGYLVSIDEEGNQTILGDTYNEADVERFPDEQSVDLPGDNICSGARMLVERILADVLFSLDQAQLAVDQFKTGAEALSLLLNTIALSRATMGALYDAWEEWMLAAASLGISTLKVAYSDPAVKSKMTENIFCAVIDSPGHLFTEEIYFGALLDLPLLESQSTILATFMRGFYIPSSGEIFEVAERYYLLGTLNEDNTCEEEFSCVEGWILECDLTLSDGGFTVLSASLAGGTWVSGTGWVSTQQVEGGGYHTNIAIEMESEEAAFTGAGMYFTRTPGIIVGDGTFYWLLNAGGLNYATIAPTATPPESPWIVTGTEFDGSGAAFQIPVGVANEPTGGTATLYKVRLYGTGLPPDIPGWVLVG